MTVPNKYRHMRDSQIKTEHLLHSDDGIYFTHTHTFILLGDETINSSLAETDRSLKYPQAHPLPRPNETDVPEYSKSPKMWKTRKGRFCMEGFEVFSSQAYPLSASQYWNTRYHLSCKRMIPSDSIPEHFDFMVSRSF